MNPVERLTKMLADVPVVDTLGMQCQVRGDEMTSVLPFHDKLIGNATIQALHGGAIATFLELSAMAQLYLEAEISEPPRTINITMDYLRQGHAKDLYARATITKLGRRMASVQAEAWQDKRSEPVASILAHFKITRGDTEPSGET